ncbi:DUF4166 domain-containing protein [Agromyces aurantiacus]|uniref:DUF4166 domain-containing protein n=1 Tax=Agromyces aurantiacus TaxID=165814 RepID=A0ABV9R7C0_9MICO|nr:DUF4166 domain-containing protein [Agromyces aurantiacus]MBM7502888.1 hypothetical protein [Agromyces aurantiacus]
MTSIFERALGSDQFERLHPMLQRRFGVGLDRGEACIGRGVMSEIRRGPWWTVPFLHLGRLRNVLIPYIGTDVPFTIENYPYLDPLGRETITFVRGYTIGAQRRRFDATMILVDGRIVDYLGTHQHLAVDLELGVDDDGSLRLRSGAQWFYERMIGFRFPPLFTGRATLHERYDEETARFHIALDVRMNDSASCSATAGVSRANGFRRGTRQCGSNRFGTKHAPEQPAGIGGQRALGDADAVADRITSNVGRPPIFARALSAGASTRRSAGVVPHCHPNRRSW